MKFGDAKPRTSSDGLRLEQLVEVLKLPNKKWIQVRVMPYDILAIATHWIDIIGSKSRKEVRIPKLCVSFDPENDGQPLKGVTCPYCAADLKAGVSYYLNVLVRGLQEDRPRKLSATPEERESGFKDFNSSSWTPLRVMRVAPSLMEKIQGLKELNKRKLKSGVKTFHISDAKFGVDINIMYNEDAKGGDKYQVNMADKVALTEEEEGFLRWNLTPELIPLLGLETPAEAKKSLARMEIVGKEDFLDADEDDEEGEDLGGRSKRGSAFDKKGKGKARRDDDDLDDDEEDDDPPPRRKKPAAKPKSRSRDEDDLDDEDEEDDDPPPRRKKPSAKPKSKSRDEDEDDDLDDADLDDEDEEDDDPPPRRKPAGKKPARKSRDEDEDDEDLDDDEEDEEDDPPPRRKPAGNKASAKAKARAKSRDEDEDDEDLDDEDLDDDPPPRRKPAGNKASSKAKAKSRDEDEEDEDDEDLYDDDIPF